MKFHEGGFKQALRVGSWKYVKPALYDLAQDLDETTDLAKQFPEIVSRTETLLLSVRTESPTFPSDADVGHVYSLQCVNSDWRV